MYDTMYEEFRGWRIDGSTSFENNWRQSRAISEFLFSFSLLTRIIVEARCRPESISFLAACFPPVCQGLSRRMHVGIHVRQSYAHRWRWRCLTFHYLSTETRALLSPFPSIQRAHTLFACEDRRGNCPIYLRVSDFYFSVWKRRVQ